MGEFSIKVPLARRAKPRESGSEIRRRDPFLDLYENGPVGYVSLSEKGFIQDVNQTGCEFLRGNRADLIGTEFRKYLTESSVETFEAHLDACSGKLGRTTCELMICSEDKEYWFEFSSVTSERRASDGGAVIVSTLLDITDRKRVEALLIRSSRLSSLGEMAAGIVHEINNPLSVVHGNAGLLRRIANTETPSAERVRYVAERIEQTSERIARIIKCMRAFSRDGSLDPFEWVSLKSLFSDTLELCKARFYSHGVELTYQAIPDEWFLWCRPTEISQVILNLLSNALDAVDAQSTKWVRLECTNLPNAFEISVTDSGVGIDPKIRERILEPFFTTKQVGKGTGLGLSISRGIVERHAGFLYLDTQSERTRFVIRLPKSGEGESGAV